MLPIDIALVELRKENQNGQLLGLVWWLLW